MIPAERGVSPARKRTVGVLRKARTQSLMPRHRLKCQRENYPHGLPKEVCPQLILAAHQWPRQKRKVFLVKMTSTEQFVCLSLFL